MNNKSNMDNNLNKNTNNYSVLSIGELKERFKNLGKNIIYFYTLPFFVTKKLDKLNFIEKLYLKININISLERLYIVLKEWVNIKEKILNIESFFR